jgi:hypothetical protein
VLGYPLCPLPSAAVCRLVHSFIYVDAGSFAVPASMSRILPKSSGRHVFFVADDRARSSTP